MSKNYKIQKQEKRNRYNIYLNDKFIFSVSENTLREFRILSSKKLNSRDLEKIKDFEEKQKILDRAYLILNYRVHGEEELRRKLQKKFENKENIDWAIKKINEQGYTNDLEVAESLASTEEGGKHRLKSKMIKRGIKKEVMSDVLGKITLEDEILKANSFLEKKSINIDNLVSFKEKQKVYRKLASKGFDTEVIKRVLRI